MVGMVPKTGVELFGIALLVNNLFKAEIFTLVIFVVLKVLSELSLWHVTTLVWGLFLFGGL